MAFPTIADADTTSGEQASNSSSWTLTYPGNIAAGDLLILIAAIDGGPTATLPAGWTRIGFPEGAVVLQAAKKKADGSESGTFTMTLSASEQGAWRIFRIPAATWEGTLGTETFFGNDANSGGAAAVGTFGTSSTPNPPSLDPATWATEDTLWIAACAVDTSRTISGYPSNVTDRQTVQVSGGSNGATLGVATVESASASLDPDTFAISASDDWAVVTIAIRPSASVTQNISPTGEITLSGALPGRVPTKVVGGAIAPTGAITRSTSVRRSGGLSPVGTLRLIVSRGFAGSIDSASALTATRTLAREFVGSVSPLGASIATIAKRLSGAVAPAGQVQQPEVHVHLIGSASPSGAVRATTHQSLAGAVTLAGALRGQPSKQLLGSVASAGALTPAARHHLAGAITPAGALLRAVARRLAGAVTPGGALVSQPVLRRFGAIAPIGSLAQSPSQAIGGTIGPTGVHRATVSLLHAGTVAPAGEAGRHAHKLLSGSLSPDSDLIAAIDRTLYLTGSLTPTGLLRQTAMQLYAGSLSLSGSVRYAPRLAHSGQVTPSGDLDTFPARSVLLEGILGPTGSLQRSATQLYSGSLGPSGILDKAVLHLLAGTLASSGTVVRAATLQLDGALAPTGDVDLEEISAGATIFLTGEIGPSGSLAQDPKKHLAGSMLPASVLAQNVGKPLAGAIAPSGSVLTHMARYLGGAITPVGSITWLARKQLHGSITLTGLLGLTSNQLPPAYARVTLTASAGVRPSIAAVGGTPRVTTVGGSAGGHRPTGASSPRVRADT